MRPEIERDLVRWNKPKWAGMVLFLIAVQVSLIYYVGRQPDVREVHPNLPRSSFSLNPGLPGASPTENPLLFATAQWNGFSGAGWMNQPEAGNPTSESLPPPRLLSLHRAKDILPERPLPGSPYSLKYRLQPPSLAPAATSSSSTSQLSVQGSVATRGLAAPLDLPPQHHNDVIGSSSVQVGVDSDGTVISARLINSSGFRKADTDALALARQARFNPAPPVSGSEGTEIDWGKLVFHWHALELGSTNTLKR